MSQDIISSRLTQYKSLFWTPDYIDVSSAWIEHIPFAFWLIEVLQPKTVVELGVHGATSYFSFCQAVKTMNINSTCYGVDTWKGDEHAGFYDEEIFQKVFNYNSTEYSRFSILIRSTFDEAREYFIDGSIDLLHIDGLHTYEAVKHDFEKWLPKLSNKGVVIFHDINVRERNFGVFKFWEELKARYTHFQFDFGHGLGIIAIDEIDNESLRELCNKNESYYSFLRNIFSERGNFFKVKSRDNEQITAQNHQLNLLNNVRVQFENDQKAYLSQVASLKEEQERLNNQNLQLANGNNDLQVANQQLRVRIEALELTSGQLHANYKEQLEVYGRLKESKDALELTNKQLQINYSGLSEVNTRLREVNTELELKNELLQQKYQQDTVELLKNTSDTQITVSSISNELSIIKKENEQLKKSIGWYKSTYETRSLLGVIKTKLSSFFKKKVKQGFSASPQINGQQTPAHETVQKVNTKKYHYDLIPANDLEASQQGLYLVTGPDPFFIVDLKDKRLGVGWYWLSIEVEETENILISPKLYFDYGRDFNEDDIWNLPKPVQSKIRCIIRLQSETKRLRFDPTTINCKFLVKEIVLKPISTIKAYQTAILMQKNDELLTPGYFTGFADLSSTLFKSGIAGVRRKLWDLPVSNGKSKGEKYTDWCLLYDTIFTKQIELIKSLSDDLSFKPLFSIVMPVYNAPLDFLKQAIRSVKNQAYPNWELCMADDKSTDASVVKLLKEVQSKDQRIKVAFRQVNGHISEASNSALALANGDYIVLMDQDDELLPHSLYMVAKAINQNKGIELIYSDEDKIDEQGNRFEPYFKTDWNKDLFYGQNMISHLGVYKKSLVEKAGGFRKGYEGSQDYDLALRCIEHLQTDQIYHIPHVLYHWRAINGSTALNASNKNYAFTSGLQALNDHLIRTSQRGKAEENLHNSYRIRWDIPDTLPKVSIIIPTKDNVNVLSNCVTSVLQKTNYPAYEIVIIDNNSQEPSTFEYFDKLTKKFDNIYLYKYNGAFNFSAINNYGVKQSTGEVVLLLNNDTEVINSEWLTEMVSQCMRKEIGAVGAKLYYPNGQIQHAGVFLCEGHPGNHIYLGKDKNDPGYFNKLNLVQNYLAVTAACLAVKKELYLKVNGLDEENLKIAYNDVDFCLKIRELGYQNLWTPFAQLVHHESLSRGNDLDEKNFARFSKERNYMLEKWKDIISDDPYFNPNLGYDTRINQLAFPPRVTYEWTEKVNDSITA